MKKVLYLVLISTLFVGVISLTSVVVPRSDAASATMTSIAKGTMRDVPTKPILDAIRFDKNEMWDVAIDARTWRLDTILSPDNDQNPFDPFDPAKLIQVKRGNTFIVDGKIYPGGTIPPGGDFDNPSSFGPDSPGSIGKWTCRGVFNFDFSDIANGAAPHVFTTQTFQFDSNDALWTDGAEGGITTVRAVTGGTGKFAGVQGQVTQETLGINQAGASRLFNLRDTFKLKK